MVIDDSSTARASIERVLTRAGFSVEAFADARSALRRFHEHPSDLIVLDIEMPGLDGWEALERIRDISNVPVLMLTGSGIEEQDTVRGLLAGADDYVTKPFGEAELPARLVALLRRAQPVQNQETFDDGYLRIDVKASTVELEGEPLAVTPTEFKILTTLTRHRGQVLSPAQLLELAWNDPLQIGPERVKFAVLRLRKKIDKEPGKQTALESVRGFGYRYRTPDRPAPS